MHAGYILNERYRIEKRIGRGGQGSVYLAHHVMLNDAVAIKELIIRHEDPAIQASVLRQFKTEAQALSRLRHAALPRVSDFFAGEPGHYYLVMDFIDGQTLGHLVRHSGPMLPAQVLACGRTLCKVLGYMHSSHLVLRDLKPDNVMQEHTGQIRIIDFGIAKVLEADADQNVTGTQARGAGTPGFAAIEQYSTGTDVRTDVYALGATLYYLLTAEPPPASPLRAARLEDVKPIGEYRTDVPASLVDAIEYMLGLSPSERPQSMEEVAQLLSPEGQGEIDSHVTPTRMLSSPSTATVSAVSHDTDEAMSGSATVSRPPPAPLPVAPKVAAETPATASQPPSGVQAAPSPAESPQAVARVAGGVLILLLVCVAWTATHGKLKIPVVPADAQVLYSQGSGTPVQAPLVGPYHILSPLLLWQDVTFEVSKAGYFPQTVRRSAAGWVSSTVSLDAANFALASNVTPSVVLVDGQAESPQHGRYSVSEATRDHEVEVRHPGYLPTVVHFHLPEQSSVNAILAPKPVRVRVAVSPHAPNVRLWVDDTLEGTTFNRQPATYLLRVSADGCQSKQLALHIEPSDAATTVPVALSPLPRATPVPTPVAESTPSPEPRQVVILSPPVSPAPQPGGETQVVPVVPGFSCGDIHVGDSPADLASRNLHLKKSVHHDAGYTFKCIETGGYIFIVHDRVVALKADNGQTPDGVRVGSNKQAVLDEFGEAVVTPYKAYQDSILLSYLDRGIVFVTRGDKVVHIIVVAPHDEDTLNSILRRWAT